jgi:lipopolysaccharide export system permease protein
VRLQEGQFITDFPGYNLLVQSVNSRTNEMRGVTIYQLNPGAPPTTIIAERGFLYYTPDGRTAVLELRDGEIHEIPPDETSPRRYRRLEFKTHIIHVAGAGGILERTVRRSRGDREMGAAALAAQRDTVAMQYATSLASRAARLRAFGAPEEVIGLLAPERRPVRERLAAGLGAVLRRPGPLEQVRRESPQWSSEIEGWYAERTALLKRISVLSVEIHKKFSVPVACVVFVLLGAPLGMRVRRAGPAVAFVSIAFFLFYYLCLIGGEELADRLIFPAWLSMWLPNILLGGWGLLATWRAFELPAPAFLRRRRRAAS